MSEQPIEVIDAAAVGAHDHPHDHPHDHEDIRAEVASLRNEWEAARMAEAAAQAAEVSTVAAEAAAEEAFDAKAAVDQLRAEIMTRFDEMAATPAAPVIVEAEPTEPTEEPPPPVENKPKPSKKKSGLSWFS